MPHPSYWPAFFISGRVWLLLKVSAVAVLALAWALAAHQASARQGPSNWGALLALAPVLLTVELSLWTRFRPWVSAVAGLLLGAMLMMVWGWLRSRVALLFFLEQTGVYLLLALLFGRSLRAPGVALVTSLALQVHGGELSARQRLYTRRVTQAWAVFFVAMASVSTLLYALAPTALWSAFANLLGGPLMGLMFLGEYAWRKVALRGERHASLADAIGAWSAYARRNAP